MNTIINITKTKHNYCDTSRRRIVSRISGKYTVYP